MGTTNSNSSVGNTALLSGCHAIITGASSGLGAEFARQLAPRAASLVLAARNGELLEALATRLRDSHPALRVVVIACDLATADGRAALWNTVDDSGLDPTLLVNNAGLGDYGEFVEADSTRLRAQIDVNVMALTLLAHEYARRAHNGKAYPRAMINISSLAASLPIPDLAVYAATKAYVTSLSEALAIELRPDNVRVLAVCPGPTPTNFSKTARREDGRDTDRSGQDWLRIPSQEVVATSLAALEHGSVRHFPGWKVRLAAFIFESMPRFITRCVLQLRRQKSIQK
ncbi:MAG: SDR family NAD(P)-dependent oxidoreductase [Verrucomicrobia bacterium]|nr:SDR family NAD(P)-dependent oxidoreductase [Verrucomicrobiota bacterium]